MPPWFDGPRRFPALLTDSALQLPDKACDREHADAEFLQRLGDFWGIDQVLVAADQHVCLSSDRRLDDRIIVGIAADSDVTGPHGSSDGPRQRPAALRARFPLASDPWSRRAPSP